MQKINREYDAVVRTTVILAFLFNLCYNVCICRVTHSRRFSTLPASYEGKYHGQQGRPAQDRDGQAVRRIQGRITGVAQQAAPL